MSRARLLEAIVQRLRALGVNATVGDCVEVWGLGAQSALFDNEDEEWAGHLMDGNDDAQFDLLLTPCCPRRSTDVETIAQAIAALTARWMRCCVEDTHDFDSRENLDGGRCRTCGVTRG